MYCPYNDFKEMDCSECGARMWVKDPFKNYTYDMVCAIAYNGGSIIKMYEPPEEG